MPFIYKTSNPVEAGAVEEPEDSRDHEDRPGERAIELCGRLTGQAGRLSTLGRDSVIRERI